MLKMLTIPVFPRLPTRRHRSPTRRQDFELQEQVEHSAHLSRPSAASKYDFNVHEVLKALPPTVLYHHGDHITAKLSLVAAGRENDLKKERNHVVISEEAEEVSW